MTSHNDILQLETTLSNTRRRLASLQGIVLNLDTTMSFDEMLTMAVRRTSEVVKAERTTLFLVDGSGALVSRALDGGDIREIRLPPGGGLAGWTARHGVPLLIPDAYSDARFDKSWDAETGFRTRDVLCHPIRGRNDRIIGVVEVLNSTDGGFNEDDVSLIGAVCNQLATIIENARVIINLVEKNRDIALAKQELERRNRELGILLDLERVLARAEDMDALGSLSFAKILDIMDADIGSMYLMNASGAHKRIYSADGRVDSLHRVEPGVGFTGYAAAKNVELDVKDAPSSPLYVHSIQERAGVSLRNLIVVPLPFEETDGNQGSVMVCNKRGGRDFDATDRVMLKLIASQLASAVRYVEGREARERDHRLATVGRLLAGVLHDLRGPITTIAGYAELMAQGTDPSENHDHLQHIKTALDRIRRMTSEIIAFSRGEKDLLTGPVSLEQFMDRYVFEIQNFLKSNNVELEVRRRVGGTVKIDQERLLRAFHNIAINAVEAMPAGGRFIFEADQLDNRLIFSFTDTGRGIPEEIQGTIFNSFVSFGKEHGTGLGLAVAREIIMGHGGQINYTTAPGAGTTFLVTIPVR